MAVLCYWKSGYSGDASYGKLRRMIQDGDIVVNNTDSTKYVTATIDGVTYRFYNSAIYLNTSTNVFYPMFLTTNGSTDEHSWATQQWVSSSGGWWSDASYTSCVYNEPFYYAYAIRKRNGGIVTLDCVYYVLDSEIIDPAVPVFTDYNEYLAYITNPVPIVSNGGGATHVAKRTGLLKDLSSYTSDILIVSGGGGGGTLYKRVSYTGKDAGGISGSGYNSADQSTGYAFGLGESSEAVASGGAGLYGGYKGVEESSEPTCLVLYDSTGSDVYIDPRIDDNSKWELIGEKNSGKGYMGIQEGYLGMSQSDNHHNWMTTLAKFAKRNWAYLCVMGETLSASYPVRSNNFVCAIQNKPTTFSPDIVDSRHTDRDPNQGVVSTIKVRIDDLSFDEFYITIYGANSKYKIYKLWLERDTVTSSGGAGSGYIGNSFLNNKKMVGHDVPTSSVESTKTESTNEVNASAASGKPKSGDGHARIKLLSRYHNAFDLFTTTNTANRIVNSFSKEASYLNPTEGDTYNDLKPYLRNENYMFIGGSYNGKKIPVIDTNAKTISYDNAGSTYASWVMIPIRRVHNVDQLKATIRFDAKDPSPYCNLIVALYYTDGQNIYYDINNEFPLHINDYIYWEIQGNYNVGTWYDIVSEQQGITLPYVDYILVGSFRSRITVKDIYLRYN